MSSPINDVVGHRDVKDSTGTNDLDSTSPGEADSYGVIDA